ncbi:hypothetical protein BD410DRAFT_837470 [Rickenella mellea]|uniref:Uncharacterized protein n=1 Tax=Rickenella mellea TaxID=50990 RepID=A0A4Y7QEG8_9AGAM|nr:hypothetical protein BD410DRAFT_837470 [Rickenella mellea]
MNDKINNDQQDSETTTRTHYFTMRGTLLSRTPATRAPSPRPNFTAPPPPIPTIHLRTVAPCINITIASSVQSPPSTSSPRKRVIPKKSKLSLLPGTSRGRVGLGSPEVASAMRSFDICVDVADDPDIGKIFIVKREKPRLREMEKQPPTLPVEVEDKEKCWSIDRRWKESTKDSKEKPYRKAPPNLNIPRRQTPANVHTHWTLVSSSATTHSSRSPRQSQHPVHSPSDQIRHLYTARLAFSNTNASVPVPPGASECYADGPPAPPPKEMQAHPAFLTVKDGSEKPTT